MCVCVCACVLPPPLHCPLRPQGVSLSAAQSDRTSAALKAHTPFSSPPCVEQDTGPRVTRTGRACAGEPARKDLRYLNRDYHREALMYSRFPPQGIPCVKVLRVKIHRVYSPVAALVGSRTMRDVFYTSKTPTTHTDTHRQTHTSTLSIKQPFVSSLISGLVSALVR